MKRATILFAFALMLAFGVGASAQTFDGEWSCEYALWDDETNGTGYATISVAVLGENQFVAMVNDDNPSYYLVPYSDADSSLGRMVEVPYTPDMTEYSTPWSDVFESIELNYALDLAVNVNSPNPTFIYVANNDEDDPVITGPGGNILVYNFGLLGLESSEYRLATGDKLWAIDVDDSGRVYVTTNNDDDPVPEVVVYDNVVNEPAWSDQAQTPTPLQTIAVPDTGDLRGVAVNSDGSALYVSNWHSKKVYRYNGSPSEGYVLDDNFVCEVTDSADTLYVQNQYPGPWGMNLMTDKGLLFVAADYDFLLGDAYKYGSMFVVDPNTGDLLDTIDVAAWNYKMADGSYYRPSTTSPGNMGGYTSTYNLDFDDAGNVYSVAYWGWTVEKWIYSGELPSIEIVGVELESRETTPNEFALAQNYPNPFNPSTTISFEIPEPANVSLKIYSINGELLATVLDNRALAQGAHEVSFDALNLASGVYLYALEADGVTLTKKMTVMK